MKKTIMIASISVIAILALGVAFMNYSRSTTGNALNSADLTANSAETREFRVNAFRFGYEPNKITVNNGDTVKIIINNTDTLHGIRIPDLNISGNDVLEFTAVRSGEFKWYCNNRCGSGHMIMNGTIVVQ